MLIIQLIIIQAVTFIALVFVLRRIMYSSSFEETKRLQQLSAENSKRAQELAAKIEGAEKQYQESLEVAEMEIRRLKAEAKADCEKLKEETVSHARQEAERIVKQALNTKEKIREELEAGLQQKSVNQAVMLIQEVLGSKNMFLLHDGFVKSTLEEIAKVDASKLNVNTDKGELIIAGKISEEDKQKLIALVCEKTGRNISLEESLNKSLLAGLVVKIGSLVLDGSLSAKFRESAERLLK
jgi:F0F1-type ATP synthase membrane subunit b/b'